MARRKITNTKTKLLKKTCAYKNCTEEQIEKIVKHKDCFTEKHKEICADKHCNDFDCAKKHNMLEKIIHRHIHHIHKHGHKLLRLTDKYNHHLTHLGELLLVGFISVTGFISAGFTPATSNTVITDHAIVAANLVKAENQGRPYASDSKIISMWMMDGDVDNSFYPGYCTYGAARISPEFFPFIEPKKQQRTWGGNAKDRCSGAQATGYLIGSTPREGALIVFNKIGSSTLFGHVGKVMYHNASKGTLIVRDMNRVQKFMMTDRRDTSDNPNISCYIYNKKNGSLLAIETVLPDKGGGPRSGGGFGAVSPTTGTLIATNTNNPQIITTIIPPTIGPLEKGGSGAKGEAGGFVPTNTNTTTTTPTTTTPDTHPTTTTTIEPEIPVNQVYSVHSVDLNFDNISDLAKHFLTQRNITAKIIQTPHGASLKIGETATLTLTIKDANTQAGFEGLLDLPFELIASNDNIETSYSLIQLIKDGKIDITLTAQNSGDTTIIINFDGEKIGKINLNIE